MIREFSLENEYAEVWSLMAMPPEGTLLLDPSGLGFAMQNSYVRTGSRFMRTESLLQQGEIKGEVIAGNYKIFRGFANYIARSETLKLRYRSVENDDYFYRDVDVVELEKTEIQEEGRVLRCPITMKCRSLYYQDAVIRYVVSATELDRRYTFPYPNRYSDYALRKDTFENDGHVDASMSFEIDGYCENPRIRISDGVNEIYDITFPVTIQTGERMDYSSMDGDIHILHVDENGTETNLVGSLSLDNDNFIRLPPGAYEVRFSSDTGTTNRTMYALHKFFRAV